MKRLEVFAARWRAPRGRGARPKSQSRRSPLHRLVVATFLAAGVAAVLVQPHGQAAAGDALPYTKGFLLTGNYVAGGVDLDEDLHPIVNGFSTAPIQMSGVPADADIVAAYLFWETITLTADESQAAGVKFRGNDIDINSAVTIEKSSLALEGATASCWASGAPLSMRMFRADVLRFLPIRLDKDDRPTGKRLVNDADLLAHGHELHTVTLPAATGNEIPESAGASLVVVYRDASEPLRKIVIYDGIHEKGGVSATMTQSLQGFYKSSAVKSAKLTHVVASGQPNNRDRIAFNGQVLATDPFFGGNASGRAWSSVTYDVSHLMNPGANSGLYGETATTTVYHQPPNGGNDCLTWGAVVFSTAVADVDGGDGDGLPDGLEDAVGEMRDPDGTVLPNLKAMGAGSDQKDIFIEVNAMWAEPGTSYGSIEAPFSPAEPVKTDHAGHHHVPTPEVLKMVGDAYAARGIRAHFDVGDVTAYHDLGVVHHSDWVDDYTSTEADHYLVGNGIGTNVASLARGGELIKEVSCGPDSPTCRFPDYPGTVGWKMGLPFIRDWPVDDSGQEFSFDPDDPAYFDWNAGTKRLRFDPARRGLFHYLLYAHARAKSKSLPCLRDGLPVDYDANSGTSCVTPNPDFNPPEYNVPSSASGIADVPGGNAMVTLGLWDEFVARPFVRTGTTFHELGHNLNLWHGGRPPIWGDKTLNTATYVEPNCKPNYLSSMSYLFQVHGLFDDGDQRHIDFSGTAFSGTAHGALNETTTLTDGALSPAPSYRAAWFAPAGSPLASLLGVVPATRFCSGRKFDPLAPPAAMARVYASSTFAEIDWNGDTIVNTVPFQDVNFDGALSGPPNLLLGFDDWANVRLDQTGAVPGGLAEGLAAEFSGLAAEFAGLAAEFAGTDEGLAAEFSGLAAEFSGLAAEFSGLEGLAAEFSGLVAEFSGLAAEFSGLAAEFAGLEGLAAEFSGLAAEFSGLAAEFAGADEGLAAEFAGLAAEFAGDEEMDYHHANAIGKGRPSGLTLCNLGTPGCRSAQPFTPEYHRVLGRFNPVPFGTGVYEVQRKRASAPDSAFVTILTTPTNEFIDSTELANGVSYAYRVRLLADDGNSGWSQPQLITAVNDAPVAVADGPYQVLNKGVFNVPAPGVLANDGDHDSPPNFRGRRAVLVTQPTDGTVTLNPNGSFTYTPPKGGSFEGLVTFTYKADDGLSADAPQVPLSGFSNTVTVSLNVVKK